MKTKAGASISKIAFNKVRTIKKLNKTKKKLLNSSNIMGSKTTIDRYISGVFLSTNIEIPKLIKKM